MIFYLFKKLRFTWIVFILICSQSIQSQQQLGPVISGENAGDYFGENTAINIDGSIIAGFSLYNSSSKGHVRVFQYTPTATTSWTQLGGDIDGKAAGDSANIRNGSNNISLNSAGNILAFGSEKNDDGGTDAGLVRIYIYNSGTSSWDQLGSDLIPKSGFMTFLLIIYTKLLIFAL